MRYLLAIVLVCLGIKHARADGLPDALRAFKPTATEENLADMLPRQQQARIVAAHERMRQQWAKVVTRADWEAFRRQRLDALRAALGPFPDHGPLRTRTTRQLAGDGFVVHNLVFESRPGLLVTANLYLPGKPVGKMPGLIIVHGFHQPKSHGELQDMGMTWARLGCAVLVPDVLCHGERRHHPFRSESDYPGKFALRRQDYYSRANAATQLELAGESLAGWMVWDTLRCVDLLLARDDIDKDKIILLGAVAAGGDVAAQAAALDERIAAVAPFNFGGPEPETVYPLPRAANQAELAFPYGLGGHWDRTRRLSKAFRDGHWPWFVTAAVAPRKLVYAHEFAWDREHDPAWQRLEQVYKLCGVPGNLAFAHGSGTLFGNPEGTGCGNIGPVHRRALYPTLQRWFGIPVPEKDYSKRFAAAELHALAADLKPGSVQQLAARLADERLAQARQEPAALQTRWQKLLGDTAPTQAKVSRHASEKIGDIGVERFALEVEPGIVVPVLLLAPAGKDARRPIVIMVAQAGKDALLKARADEIAQFLQAGVNVCLPDLRGTGASLPRGERRGPPAGTFKGTAESSPSTLLASGEQLLGDTLLGERIRDLRTVLAHVRKRSYCAADQVYLWGDSLSATNPAHEELRVPWDAKKLPHLAEPLGALSVLLTGLLDKDVAGIVARGGLVGYRSLLDSPFIFVPVDAIVPGALTAGDVSDVALSLAPRPLRIANPVDGRNRPVSAAEVQRAWKMPRADDPRGRLSLVSDSTPAAEARWLLQLIKKP